MPNVGNTATVRGRCPSGAAHVYSAVCSHCAARCRFDISTGTSVKMSDVNWDNPQVLWNVCTKDFEGSCGSRKVCCVNSG